MKLDCILTAVNENPLYLDFIPIFIKTWKKLYPLVDIKIILISNKIPENLNEYQDYIILFEPIEKISTAFISQYIRLLYPAILNYENGVMITDMDMLPMNRTYYSKNIEAFTDDKFIYLRNVLLESNQIAMCYNVSTPNIWSEIFNIKTIEDVKNRLIERFNNIKYIDGHGNFGWSIDQLDFYNYVTNWNNKTNNFVILNDKNTGYCRLDRSSLKKINEQIINNIKNGKYSDYHCHRPYNNYKILNDTVYESL
jgi:hypothetical protein